MGAMTTTSVYCLFFDGYETLDAMGPIEFLHRVPDVRMRYISVAGASESGSSLVRSAQGFTLKTEIVESLPPGSILLIPGGIGTRSRHERPIPAKPCEIGTAKPNLPDGLHRSGTSCCHRCS